MTNRIDKILSADKSASVVAVYSKPAHALLADRRLFFLCQPTVMGSTCRPPFVGRQSAHTISEEVIIQLILNKYMPILMYGLEACRLNESDISSLDLIVHRLFMKMFKTKNMEIVRTY